MKYQNNLKFNNTLQFLKNQAHIKKTVILPNSIWTVHLFPLPPKENTVGNETVVSTPSNSARKWQKIKLQTTKYKLQTNPKVFLSLYFGRGPVDNDRGPVHNGKRPVHNDRRPLHNDKRPVHNDKRPLHNGRRPVHNDRGPVYNGCISFNILRIPVVFINRRK